MITVKRGSFISASEHPADYALAALGVAEKIVRAGRRFLQRETKREALHRYTAAGDLAGMILLLPEGWDEWYAEGTYEPDLAAALKRLVRPGDVCVDAGAHYGYFSLLLARLCSPNGVVYAFEANSDNARVIGESVRANGLDTRVVVEEAAVAADDGVIELFQTPTRGSTEWTTDPGFAYRSGDSPPGPPLQVRSMAFDRFLASLDRVNLIKMDIEGAEGVVLPTLEPQLRRLRPTIVLEFHREVGWPAIGALLTAGYTLESLEGSKLSPPRSAGEVPYQLVALPPHQ